MIQYTSVVKCNAGIFGGVAQLGERLNGIQEVIGSIPTVSTKRRTRILCGFFFFLFCIWSSGIENL